MWPSYAKGNLLMSNPRTLALYREQQQAEMLLLIDEVLNDLRKRKVTYEYLSHLSQYVAAQISRTRKKPLSYTTLNRNPVYKKRLQLYMGTSHAAKELTIAERKDLEEQVYDLKLSLGKTHEENRRLKAYIADIDAGERNVKQISQDKSEQAAIDGFKQLAILINALKEYFNEELEWTSDNKVIDEATGNVIVDGDPVMVFNEHLKRVSKFHGDFDG